MATPETCRLGRRVPAYWTILLDIGRSFIFHSVWCGFEVLCCVYILTRANRLLESLQELVLARKCLVRCRVPLVDNFLWKVEIPDCTEEQQCNRVDGMVRRESKAADDECQW
jgi:hypothetical protein